MLDKFKSRKLWIAVIGVVFFILNNQSTEAVAIIGVYLGAQGYVDGKNSK